MSGPHIPLGTPCRRRPRKIVAAFDFEQSPLFSERERAALRFGWHASVQPNAIEPADFVAVKAFFSEREVVEIVAIVSLFGFLNRWNDTLATELEPKAVEFGNEALAESGMTQGKH